MVLVTLLSALLTFCMHKVLKTKDHHTIPSSALIWKYFSLTMYITIYRKWKIYCNFSFCVGELGDHEGMACRTGYLSEFQFFPGQVCYSQNDLFTNLYKKKKLCAYINIHAYIMCSLKILFVFYGTYTMGQSTIIVACPLSVLCTTPLATKV